MGRYLINAFFDLEEKKKEEIYEKFMTLSLSLWLLSNDWPSIRFNIEAGKRALSLGAAHLYQWALCSSDSFLSGAFKRDVHCCLEGEGRPLHYPGLYPRGSGLEG